MLKGLVQPVFVIIKSKWNKPVAESALITVKLKGLDRVDKS